MKRFTRLLLPIVAALAVSPAAAQVGVLDQPFRNDPFQPLLEGRWSFTHYLSAGADNNTLGVGDMVAIGYLAGDFRPGDIFLVAGLVPEGDGVRLGGQQRTAAIITVPVGPFLTLGLNAGGRVIATGAVPDAVASLVRDGVVGDEVSVDLTELGGEAFGYAEAGLSAVVDLPLTPTPVGNLQLMLGAGGRYVRSVSHMRVGFSGDDGAATSTFTLTRTGVDTELAIATPLTEDVLAEGGSGVALDAMAGLALGRVVQLRLAVTDFGSTEVRVGRRAVSTVTLDDVDLVDLGSTADSATVTDTLPATTRQITLPTTLRADLSFRPFRRLGLGARIAAPLDDAPALEPLAQAGIELRLFHALPLRVGVLGGGEFGTGYFGGIGLDTRLLRLDLELTSTGGPAPADVRGGYLRTAMALRF